MKDIYKILEERRKKFKAKAEANRKRYELIEPIIKEHFGKVDDSTLKTIFEAGMLSDLMMLKVLETAYEFSDKENDHKNKELSERVERLEKTLEKVKAGYEWNMEHVKKNVDRADYEMYDEIKEVLKRKWNRGMDLTEQ